MTALAFLHMLAQQYRENHFYLSASLLTFALNSLKEGKTEEALVSIRRSKYFLVDQMKNGQAEVERFGHDLVLLNTIEEMIKIDG